VKKAGHVEANRQLKRLGVLALSIGIQKGRGAEHGRMVGIKLHGRFDHLRAPLYLAGVVHEQPQQTHDRSIHGIECYGLFHGRAKAGIIFISAEKVSEGQRIVAEGMGGRQIYGALCRSHGSLQRVGPGIVFVGKLGVVHNGQHRPGVGLVRVPLHGALQNATCCRMFRGAYALKKTERAKHCLVRRQALFVLAAQLVADPPRQNAILISRGRDNARNEVILQREKILRAERAFIVLGPQMRAGDGVNKLDGEPQLRSRLTESAFDHVARAEFLADRANITRFARISCRRTTRDHLQVGEVRQSGHDFFGQSVG